MSKNDTSTSDSPLSGFRPSTEPRGCLYQTSKGPKSSPAPLLITESRGEYKKLRRALRDEINPRGPVEWMYFTDIVQQEWEIRRWRRAKVARLNTAYREVLEFFLPDVLCRAGKESWECSEEARVLSFLWFSNLGAQERVAKKLAVFGLDATAIEAQVLQRCHEEFAEFDRLLASAESRRLRAVRALAEYRGSLRRHIASDSRADAKKKQ